MSEPQGCSVVVVFMVSALAFLAGAGGGAAGVYFFAPKPEATTTVVEAPAQACPPCEQQAAQVGGGKDYALVYPIEDTLKISGGTLPMDAVRNLVKSKRHVFSKCYQDALTKEPGLKGEMTLQFRVSGSTGRVLTTAERELKIGNDQVRECVFAEVKKWTFEPTKGPDSDVRFDMLFVPLGSAPME